MSATNGAAPKRHLVRGIDPIPEDWELVSMCGALESLSRGRTILERVIAEAVAAGNKRLARDLRRVETGVRLAQSNIAGGFDRKEIEPKAEQLKQLRASFSAQSG
jgi:hypothetical protein